MRNNYLPGNDIRLVHSGEAFFEALHEVILSASEVLHLQFYIFDPDETGQLVMGWLQEAVNRGVKVWLVTDGFGSKPLRQAGLQQLRNNGIQVMSFSPLLTQWRFRLGQRMHRKIVVADGERALVGGINVSDKYRGIGEPAWLDYAVDIRGPLCVQLEKHCRALWLRQPRLFFSLPPTLPQLLQPFLRFLKRNFVPYKKLPPLPFPENPEERGKPSLAAVLRRRLFSRKKGNQFMIPLHARDKVGKMHARLSINDWLRHKREVSTAYRIAFRDAQKEILLLTPYFIPGYKLRTALQRARHKGVRVVFIVPGVSDVPFIRRATLFLYEWLLQQGVEIYEWHGSVLHGKVCVIDRSWSTVGSYNPNALSDFFSLETNVDIRDNGFAGVMADEIMQQVIPQCTRVREEEFSARSGSWARFLAAVSYYTLYVACLLALPDKRKVDE